MFVEVALDVRVFDLLSYRVPDALRDTVKVGQLVHVPFRNQRKTGLVVAITDVPPADIPVEKVRDLMDVVDLDPVANPDMMSFLRFVADYYFSPFSEVLRVAIPSTIRTEGTKHYTPVEGFDGTLSPELAFALAEIQGTTAVSVVRERTGIRYIDLMELERIGAVEVSYEEVTKVSEKKTKMLQAETFSFDGRLGEKQKAILSYLQRRSAPVEASEIREMFGTAYSSVKSLVQKGLVRQWEEVRYRDPFDQPAPDRVEPVLNAAQTNARDRVVAALNQGVYRSFLLHGVTGSGKTEVYLSIIREARRLGKSAIVLLPEIALTPQFVSVFRGAFEGEIAVLHSGLTAAKKFDQWRQIRAGELPIVIGARSALFAPLTNVGVIVVDEEHDPSFKQEEGVRYNARDMAMVRASKEKAVVVLGSATPSLESFENTRSGKLVYLQMPDRISDRPLPAVELTDLKTSGRVEDVEYLSTRLQESLGQTLDSDEQAILFLNRRGFSPCILCGLCGHIWRCPSCDVSLTYHRSQEALRCHHCDHVIRLPEHCPECENRYLGPKGVGTEQLADVISSLVPGAIVGRLDRDTGRGKKLRAVLDRFANGETNVLVGTQMVTKGHDFPNVTLVGVVHADTGLNFPDFRGAERTFQLLTQVAGRAGRGEKRGRVVIQSYDPSHFALQTAARHDYEAFAEQELARRKMFGFPPFGHLIAVKFEGTRGESVMREAYRWATAIKREIRLSNQSQVSLRGPTVAPFERLRNKYRWQLLVQSEDRAALRRIVGLARPAEPAKGVRSVIDVDPVNLL